MLSTSTGCSQGGGPSLVSESVSSGVWGACVVDSVGWNALNGRLLGGGAAGEAGEEGE